MEDIVAREDGTDPTTRLLFPSLTRLRLYGLPKLKWFFQRVRTLESSSSKELHEQGGTLFEIEEVAVPNLTNLDLSGLPIIKHVWSRDSQTILNFQNLQEITAKKCASLESLFPASVGSCLKQLKKIIIDDCGVMEEIASREDGTDPTTKLLFPNLYFLTLAGLPKLKWFFQGVRTLESSSSKELHEQGGTLFGIEEVAFPNLTNLDLCGLPIIKHVWSKDSQTILSFKNLQEIIAKKCASLERLFPVSVGSCLKQLQEIIIIDCGVLEEIVGAEGGEAVGSTLVFVFPRVTSLILENLPRLECFYKGVHISKWPMLKEMQIYACEKVEVFASGLVSKETVEDKQSQMLIKQPLFLVDEMSFPSLELLRISGMEKLGVIWYGQVAASLNTLQISDCGSLEAVFEQHEGQNGKEYHGLTATQRLREMSLSSLPKLRNIWNIKDSHQRHMYGFPNLLHIDVKGCESLKSLFPAASVAARLPQLQSLMITGCGVMEEIVERDDGTDPTTKLLFPSLICLGLYGLSKLKWFFQGCRPVSREALFSWLKRLSFLV